MKYILSLCVVVFPFTVVRSAEPAPGLKYVQPDAAAFVHVDASQIVQWKLAKAILPFLIKGGEAEKVKQIIGLDKDFNGLSSVTVYWPQLAQPRDTERMVAVVRVNQPINIKELVKELPNTMTYDDKTGIISSKAARAEEMVTIDTATPSQLVIAVGLGDKYLKLADATATGTLAPAIKSASNGSALTVGIAMLKLPDDIRGDNIPPDARPFLPILKSELLTLQGTFNPNAKDATDIFISLSVEAKDKAAAGEVEKSIEALRTMAKMGIELGYKELDPKKDKATAELFTPLLKRAEKMVTDAKITANDNTVSARLTLGVDIDPAPFIVRMKESAERAKAMNNMKQLGLALHNYEGAYGMFPPSSTIDKKGKPMLSWRVMILPYIEEEALYKQFKLDEPWDSEHNAKVLKDNPMPKVFAIDGTKNLEEKVTHYQAFVGNGAALDPVKGTKFVEFADGSSNTLLLGTAAKAVAWTKPDDIEFDPKKDPRKLILFAKSGTLVSFADGSVRFLKESISEDTLKALITKSGGETVKDDE